MLAADCVLVGFLATTMVGSNFLMARRATQAAGVALLPEAGVCAGRGLVGQPA